MVHVDDPTMSPETQKNPKPKSLNPKGPATKLSCSGLGDVDAVSFAPGGLGCVGFRVIARFPPKIN